MEAVNIFTAKALNFQKGNALPDSTTDRIDKEESKDGLDRLFFELDLEEELLLQEQLEQQLREDEEMGNY